LANVALKISWIMLFPAYAYDDSLQPKANAAVLCSSLSKALGQQLSLN